MSVSLYDVTCAQMIRTLGNLLKIMDKAEEQAKAKGIALSTLMDARLAPDMHPFKRQIQIASDSAKGCAGRLTGGEVPSFADTEETFDELKARLAKTIDYLKSVKASDFDGQETRHIEIKTPNRTFEMNGLQFAAGFALPNFYFHVTTAYGLLRHSGIEIGKGDYLGS